jgi:hypothetical protein
MACSHLACSGLRHTRARRARPHTLPLAQPRSAHAPRLGRGSLIRHSLWSRLSGPANGFFELGSLHLLCRHGVRAPCACTLPCTLGQRSPRLLTVRCRLCVFAISEAVTCHQITSLGSLVWETLCCAQAPHMSRRMLQIIPAAATPAISILSSDQSHDIHPALLGLYTPRVGITYDPD